mmetsp:Transcript_28148/g.41552  ORF Transcript_28148/g.41552 Transcript_28148/m.41552 type:complete len:537 (-) Transcript_28148:104-1714(-)
MSESKDKQQQQHIDQAKLREEQNQQQEEDVFKNEICDPSASCDDSVEKKKLQQRNERNERNDFRKGQNQQQKENRTKMDVSHLRTSGPPNIYEFREAEFEHQCVIQAPLEVIDTSANQSLTTGIVLQTNTTPREDFQHQDLAGSVLPEPEIPEDGIPIALATTARHSYPPLQQPQASLGLPIQSSESTRPDSIETNNGTTVIVPTATVVNDNAVEIVTTEAQREKMSFYLKGRELKIPQLVWAFIAVVVIVGAVTLTLILKGSNNQEDNTQSRYDEMRDIVSSISSLESLDNSSSPQARALQWLCCEDRHELPTGEVRRIERIIQRYTLAVIFYSMGGSEWEKDFGFLSENHECKWVQKKDNNLEASFYGWSLDGVSECNDGKVTQVMIYRNGQNGTIPSEIQYLTHLTHLDFALGSLYGTIPVEIGNLTNLQYLSLASNNLSGTVPKELLNLKDLSSMNVALNPGIKGDIDYLCPLEDDGSPVQLSANCHGTSPEVTCTCCHLCCDQNTKECCRVQYNDTTVSKCVKANRENYNA